MRVYSRDLIILITILFLIFAAPAVFAQQEQPNTINKISLTIDIAVILIIIFTRIIHSTLKKDFFNEIFQNQLKR